MHREHAGSADAVERAEFAGLEDDFQMRVTAGFFYCRDLVEDVGVLARQERPARDDHVDLVGAGVNSHPRVVQLDLER